ncbi:hypothetical protein H2201_005905 [Coniosporium apollinis]|uniref:C2H2-type domain-containing protein n=1 Tax=Coniosporium apollinis TaxID=61459 RepID=A0ABQ9NNG9_9PEZI|nr:hypothetical protein H2201_005905 [Coniosporium apollinis]
MAASTSEKASGDTHGSTSNSNTASSDLKSDPTPNTSTANFPPPKTDKPRPHVCQTCGRCFARLEHLKRHERSHTKEKPFECPQCQRCFARRDLLLRHQQKLHQAGAASSRPRNIRRESTSGQAANGSGRVRKNSIASGVAGSVGNAATSVMRPRANTISHIDMNMMASNASLGRSYGVGGHTHHPSLTGLSSVGAYEYRGMSTTMGPHSSSHGLPRLDTHLGAGLGGGLRTAPVAGFGDSFDVDKFLHDATINPAQLHFGGAAAHPGSPFPTFHSYTGDQLMEAEQGFQWPHGSIDDPFSFSNGNDPALDGSSPSAISTASQSGFSEVMLDGSNNPAQKNGTVWGNRNVPPSTAHGTPFTMEPLGSSFHSLLSPMHTISPQDLHEQSLNAELYLHTPPAMPVMSPTAGIPGMPNQYFHPHATFNSDSTSISSSSANGSASARHSSVTSVSSESITDATRNALIISLSQPITYGQNQRKYSQSTLPASLVHSPRATPTAQPPSLPSTADLQRYVSAYIHYFHPHMPFLHIPTLTFDAPAFTSNLRTASGHMNFGQDGIVGGAGCLILAMAAIGALYEFEHAVAHELFEAAKKMIHLYFEEHRRANVSASLRGANVAEPSHLKTPVWLVQSMLLNIIYGHNCGDKRAAESATTQCAALISLAKAAELDQPDMDLPANQNGLPDRDITMGEDGLASDIFRAHSRQDYSDEHLQWITWKTREERKRTWFAVFILSSLLVTAYNQAPRILNSELLLDLPCEENLWSVDNVHAWLALGGASEAERKTVSFAKALSFLLTASQRPHADHHMGASYHETLGTDVSMDQFPESELKPSTFGCYILINALHVYIWETRQRHNGRLWTTQETETMHAQVEPALAAWQTAWRANPNHSLERPNPYGPLPADCIPLLDLAYVRLFVNLGRSKEGFFTGDFDAMAEELARGHEIIQHADNSPTDSTDMNDSTRTSNTSTHSPGMVASPQDLSAMATSSPGTAMSNTVIDQASQLRQSSKRERHLRKAAFYAADSLSMSDKLGVTFADFTSRELPLQSAMCTFDCAQVLAEWVATVQERVGRYMGILGKDEIDYQQVPSIVLLEDEDVKLLQKIQDILQNTEMKIAYGMGGMGSMSNPILSTLNHCGFGSKLLLMTAYMMEKAAVWPVTRVMARALEAHAAHMNQRAAASVS